MNIKNLCVVFLLLGFTYVEAQAQLALTPTSDFRGFVYCANGKEKDKVDFTAFTEEPFKYAKNAILISNEQPFAPSLNKVSYEIFPDHTIKFEHEIFSLVIQPSGIGVYQRKDVLDTPPDLPGEDETKTSQGGKPSPQNDGTLPLLFKPLSLRCHTPFTQNDVTPPTGFSVGN